MGNTILRERKNIISAFWGYSWQKCYEKQQQQQQQQQKKKKTPHPFTFEQTIAEPALNHYLGKIKIPPYTHTHAHTDEEAAPALCR